MHWRDLLHTARDLLAVSGGKPRQANLHRATSTAYYAMFHALAGCAADLLIGGTNSARHKDTWKQVYRAIDHRAAKEACKPAKIAHLPQEIQDFANMFAALQEKRHNADYDPTCRSTKSAVAVDINQAQVVIEKFQSASAKDKRAFVALVMFKAR